jgi:hypothetical protein
MTIAKTTSAEKPAAPKATLEPVETERERRARAELTKLNTNVHVYDGRRLTFPYQVAPGKKLTTGLGELVQGARVTPELVGGQATLDRLVEKRVVLRAAVAAA